MRTELKISARCSGCGACISACPFRALSLETEQEQGRGKKQVVVNRELCCGCGACIEHCPRNVFTLGIVS